jgi:hypothetical protein
MLDAAVESCTLPTDAVLDASASASAAFDPSPLGLRFRVPSAGFLLVWSTSPNSPAHNLARCGTACMNSCPRFDSATADQQGLQVEVCVEVSGPPVDRTALNHAVSMNVATSPPHAAPWAVPAHEDAEMRTQQGHQEGLHSKDAPALFPQSSQKSLPAVSDAGKAHEAPAISLFAAAPKNGSPGQGTEASHSLKRALE